MKMKTMKKNRDESILIVLIAGIGDLILGSKSIRAMRKGYPNAMIHLLTSAEAFPLAQNYDFIDHVFAFPIRQLRKSKFLLVDILGLILKLRKTKFQTAINLYRISTWSGSIKMALLFLLLRAQERIGHSNRGFGVFLDKKSDKSVYQNQHFVNAMLDIALLAGGISDDKGTEVYWDKSCEKELKGILRGRTDGKRFKIGINPGADVIHKRWNPEYYAIVADNLIQQFSAEIFILGGPGEEALAARIESKMKNSAVNLAGKLTLNGLVYVINEFDLLLTNDSGPMHIAAALKTPIVAIFGPEDPIYTKPFTSNDLYRIVYREVNCRPCSKKDCARPLCLDLITPEEVMERCVELLSESGA